MYNSLFFYLQFKLTAGKLFEIPLIATEQYPEKLGKIIKDFDVSHADGVYGKTLFSMLIPEVKNKLNDYKLHNGLQSVVIFGLEVICYLLQNRTKSLII